MRKHYFLTTLLSFGLGIRYATPPFQRHHPGVPTGHNRKGRTRPFPIPR